VRVIIDPHGDSLLAVDSEGLVVAWPLAASGDRLAAADSVLLGATTNPGSMVQALATDRIAFASGSGLVAVRSMHDNSPGQSLNLDGVKQVTLAPGGNALIAEGASLLRLWRLDADPLGNPPALEYSAAAIDPGGELAAFGFRGGHVRLRDLSSDAPDNPMSDGVDYIGHRGAVTSLVLGDGRETIISGGADGVVRIWDRRSLAPNEYFLRHPSGPVTALDLSRDGRLIVSGADASARVWAAGTGALLRDIQVDGEVMAVRLAPGGDIVAVGDSSGNIFFGSPRGGEPLRSARAQAAVTSLAFAEDGTEIASGDRDGNLLIWSILTAAQLDTAYRFAAPIDSISFVDQGLALSVKSGQWVHRLERQNSSFEIVATRLLPASLGHEVVLVRLADGRLRALGASGRGQTGLYEFSMQAAGQLPTQAGYFTRDWPGMLGLSIDTLNGRLTPAFR
jgi:WD40 repeat protein